MIRERLLAIAPAALLAAPALIMVFTLTQAAAARAMGVSIQHVALGIGPKLAQAGTVRLHALPISAHILFTEEDTGEGVLYATLSPTRQILLQLSGPAALAALTAPLWSLNEDLGIICGVLALMNLLPMPGTAGGQVSITLMEAASGERLPDGLRIGWLLASMVGVWGAIGWLFLG